MKKQTAGRDILGELAPEFARLNDDVLFGEEWARENELSPKLRSIATISALMGKGIIDSSLKSHIEMGRRHGISKKEMVELLTHLAFYAGWPNAWGAFRLALEVYKEDKESIHGGVYGMGEENVAYAQYFTGKSYLKRLTDPSKTLSIANVTFEPSCRNHWHIHHATKGGGQILIGSEGEGWYVEEGKEPVSIKEGDVVVIPSNVKHWHGAKKGGWFSHLAIEVPGEGLSNEWLEEVSDEEYSKL